MSGNVNNEGSVSEIAAGCFGFLMVLAAIAVLGGAAMLTGAAVIGGAVRVFQWAAGI